MPFSTVAITLFGLPETYGLPASGGAAPGKPCPLAPWQLAQFCAKTFCPETGAALGEAELGPFVTGTSVVSLALGGAPYPRTGVCPAGLAACSAPMILAE